MGVWLHVRGREEVQVLSNVPIVRCQHAFERAGCTTIVTTGQLTPHRQWECEWRQCQQCSSLPPLLMRAQAAPKDNFEEGG